MGGGKLTEKEVPEEHITVSWEPFPKYHYTN